MIQFDFLKANIAFQIVGGMIAIIFLLMYIAFYKKPQEKKR